MNSRRQIRLYRSDLRELFSIPDDVEIAGVGVWQEPLGIQITLIGDDSVHWEPKSDGWDSEDSESYILSKDHFDERDDNNQG